MGSSLKHEGATQSSLAENDWKKTLPVLQQGKLAHDQEASFYKVNIPPTTSQKPALLQCTANSESSRVPLSAGSPEAEEDQAKTIIQPIPHSNRWYPTSTTAGDPLPHAGPWRPGTMMRSSGMAWSSGFAGAQGGARGDACLGTPKCRDSEVRLKSIRGRCSCLT